MNTNQIPPEKKEVVPEGMLEIVHQQYRSSQKLAGQVAIITGGDSGIGRSISVMYAMEGADVAIVYHSSDDDAHQTKQLIEKEGRKCILFKGDIADETFCKKVVEDTVAQLGKLTILINNAGVHEEDTDLLEISSQQFRRTFEVNMFSFFYFSKEALRVMEAGSCIINTVSVVAYRGSEHLMDYSATKGAVLSFTRSLAKNLATKGIRVNAVAPGPIWTPLVIESFEPEKLQEFGKKTPMNRAGKPSEVAPAYVFLASADASYITGQVIHVNGGEVVGG